MLNFVWIIPVNAPAINPPSIANIVAIIGLTPATIRAAAIEAPRVIDPSAVISAKLKILKLINIPRPKELKSSLLSLHQQVRTYFIFYLLII